VVSEDICVLLQSWGRQRGFATPQNGFLTCIRSEMRWMLEKIFGIGQVEFVSAQDITNGLLTITETADAPIVSLDRSYLTFEYHLDINRAVDTSLNDHPDIERFDNSPIDEQISVLKQHGLTEITLLDDVIFSGSGMACLIDRLDNQGIKVAQAIAGIAIDEGKKRLGHIGTTVMCVRYFNEVIDEICERDFYPGVPLSGRCVTGSNTNIGAPYLRPFGKPTEWASIPNPWAQEFSQFCLNKTIQLWEEVERLSNQTVRCCDLDRTPIGIPSDESRFVDRLCVLV